MNSQYVQIQNENCQLDGRLGERKTYQQVNQENAAVLYNVDYLVTFYGGCKDAVPKGNAYRRQKGFQLPSTKSIELLI